MIERLLALDAALFLLLNAKLTHAILDRVMPAITTQENWYPILGVAAAGMLIWGGRKGRLAVIMLIVGIGLTDQISCSVLKPLVGRIRPCNVFDAHASAASTVRSVSWRTGTRRGRPSGSSASPMSVLSSVAASFGSAHAATLASHS